MVVFSVRTHAHATLLPWSFDQSKKRYKTRRTAASSSSHQAESTSNSATVCTRAMEAELPTWPARCRLSSSSPAAKVSMKSTATYPASPTSDASIHARTTPPAAFPNPAVGLMLMVQQSSLPAPQRHELGQQHGASRPSRPLDSDLHSGGAPHAGVAGALHTPTSSASPTWSPRHARRPGVARK